MSIISNFETYFTLKYARQNFIIPPLLSSYNQTYILYLVYTFIQGLPVDALAAADQMTRQALNSPQAVCSPLLLANPWVTILALGLMNIPKEIHSCHP